MKLLRVLKNMISGSNSKLAVFLLAAVIIFGAFFPLKQAQAQLVVTDIPVLVWNKVSEFTSTLWRKAGSIAFNRTLTTALNKIAYDTATWIGSGQRGQKPLFITNPWTYLGNVGDEAAGQFLESFVNNLNRDESQNCDADYKACMEFCYNEGISRFEVGGCFESCQKQSTACVSKNVSTINVTPSFNVCQPSSLAAKVKIGLGLVEQSRPQGPNCTLSEIVRNWSTDSVMRAAGFGGTGLTGEEYLRHFQDFFDPRANDLGIYVSAQTDLANQKGEKVETAITLYQANKGWLDVRNIAGDAAAPPGTPERELESAKRAQETNIGTITGDAFIDAANVFINQYAISAFNELMRSLADKGKSGGSDLQAGLRNPFSDPGAYSGVSSLKDVTTKLLQPNFGVRTDYDILSSLVICPDQNKPGPDNCVIDDQFMQAISEKKTVAEALENNYLHGEWQLTDENLPSTYNLRNISILRKYRIVPAGWEEAVRKIVADGTPKKATLTDLVSCFSNIDSYVTFSSEFDQRDQSWCAGLVDPNWVLKAPLNYCRQEGVGGYILNKTIVPGVGGSSELSIVRADNYCADNQTCIKEKTDGSCEVYGYCNEEKRTWSFGSDTCEPINNTCQAFTSSTGQNVAYLQNTLDYSSCNSETAGCRQYALSGIYDVDSKKVSWSSAVRSYFDNNLSGCNSTDEGCVGLFRVKPTWGSNLVMNSDFGNDEIGDESVGTRLNDWFLSGGQGEIVNSATEPGGKTGKAIKVITTSASGGLYSSRNASLLPKNLETIPGQAYTLSADVYLVNGTDVRLIMGSDPSSPYTEVSSTKGRWQRLSVTRSADSAYLEPSFAIFAAGPVGTTMYVMNVKFEMGNWDTGYSSYGSYRVHQKIVPSYLEQTCYEDSNNGDYRLKNDAPAACAMFARKCNKSEVGCESYLSSTDKFRLSAQVTSADYCSAQCLGYNEYIAKGSYFSSPSPDRIIPSKAKTCAAASVGCMEFTNLDDISQGGEGKEYYSSLKQCIKPSLSDCATFYSWEGTGSGYQLKAYSLKKDTSGLPAVTSSDTSLCNANIYRLPVTDPGYNPDCREYYNAAGQVAYHLSSRTITCSENCHPYRMTEKNVDRTLTLSQCTGPDKHWDTTSSSCNVCQNGGVWNAVSQACIYQAIPGEGQSCQAVEVGCREYNGSRGANVKLMFAHDYENDLAGWSSNCSGGVTHSSVSNNNNGRSLQYNNNVECNISVSQANDSAPRLRIIEKLLADENLFAQVNVAGSVKQGSAYTVKFIARSASNISLKVFFLNPETAERSYFNDSAPLEVKGGNEWNIYQINLAALDHQVSQNEVLAITANGTFNLDDFVMSEITDRYYLIKGSSVVPNICSYDIFDNYQGDEYNLGCSEYTDRAGQKHNLHRFSSLCSNTAVGCEQMIDTHNYNPYQTGYWLDGQPVEACATNDPSCLVVSSDSAMYAVFDNSKRCTAGNQGCSRFGEGQGGANLSGWIDVYKKNNPDQYSNILCGSGSVGCEEWRNRDNGQSNYFKNPGTAACIYRTPTDPLVANKSWFRVPVKRCDLNSNGVILDAPGFNEQSGAECISDNDCLGGVKCVMDRNDYPCSYTYDKTFGLGGAGNQIPVPNQQAGLCDASFSSCTEYLDPVSRAAANILINPAYEKVDGIIEGWGNKSVSGWPNQVVAANQQFVRVRPNRMYHLIYKAAKNSLPSGVVTLNFQNEVKILQTNNQLGVGVLNVTTDSINNPVIFNSLHNDFALVTGGDEAKVIEIKEIMMGYQLANKVDKTSCNGLTDFDNGCVLFNERSVSGANGLASLTSDPFQTADNESAKACEPGSSGCATNQLIKVRPDRVCAKWLDCISFIQDPYTKKKTCYAFAECDRLDDKGECANFIGLDAPQDPVIEINQNSTGYTPANKYSLSDMRVVGKGIEGIDGDFDTGTGCNFDKRYCIISGPDVAKAQNATDYPADGTGYLMISAGGQYILPNNLTVKALSGEDFYINYLLSTKNSGGSTGRIRFINNETDNAVADLAARAESGWQRIVQPFRLPTGLNNISIYLEALGGPVYFDDVSIEPVLKTAANSYSVSECRLYPTNDSLTCTSKNKNVISDGLKGYCIEKDPANPDVCLMWYPMDNIPLPNFSSKGYDGNFPLNYCTRTSGNFDFMEYRRGYWLDSHTEDDPDNNHPTRCVKTEDSSWTSFSCPDDYNIWISEKMTGNISDYTLHRNLLCIPKEDLLKDREGLSMVDRSNNTAGDSANAGNWEMCSSVNFSTGYAVYDGFDGFEVGEGPGYVSLGSEPTPNLVIRDYNSPATGYSDLKYIPGTFEAASSNKYYHFVCDQIAEAVDSSGRNAMWVDRVKNNSSLQTIDFTSSPFKFNVTQNHENRPFGGLVGDVPSEGIITLADITTQPLAGLPYSCLNGTGSNCNSIGYCSEATSTLCLAPDIFDGPTSLELKTCGPGKGTCTPLFNNTAISQNSSTLVSSVKDFLKNISLAVYRIWDNNANLNYVPSSSTLIYNYTRHSLQPLPLCPNPTRGRIEYCAMFPKISNLKLFFNNSPAALTSTSVYDVKQKGIYRLEFNSEVDKEQQPLKRIVIDWGDGYEQTITNQDDRPQVSDPHIFYHYYNKTGPKEIDVRIYDNWNFCDGLKSGCQDDN